MWFDIVGPIRGARTMAVGRRIREIDRLVRIYGPGRWKKRKGLATVRLPDGTVRAAELHWYEAAGIGRREFKIKHFFDPSS